MTRKRTTNKQARKRYSDDFKSEALALADRVGVSHAASDLGVHESQLYNWRSKANRANCQGEIEDKQAAEIARLKRQLADQAEELAILKKASAYFAKNQK